MMVELFGGIEGGGTKFVCAIGSGPDDILAETRFPTTTPVETLGKAVAFFVEQQGVHGPLTAIGLASFGPLDPNPTSPTYGQILPTPKHGWTNANLVSLLRDTFNVPIGFDTDVNGAALAEARWGAGQGCDPVIYLTIGTGIGGGVMQQAHMLPLVRQKVQALLNGYVQSLYLTEWIDQYIVLPGLARRAGVLGALTLAQQAYGQA
jgi:fructokinase